MNHLFLKKISSMVNFLSVPLKSTNEVDLYKPLKTYIDSLSELSEDVKSEANEGLLELNKLRNKACCQPLDKHQSSLDVITRYYDQLCAIEAKLPITPTLNPISFKWKDAFGKSSLFFSKASLTLNDSSFERACVLFNCGALMSNIAASQQMHSDEELKSVAKMFQLSAGIFSKLKDSVFGLVQQEPTPDLSPDALSSLSLLMVAQAQESVYIKASRDKMKPSSLLKIAAQCSEMYSEALKFMCKDSVKGMWDKEWIPIVTAKGMAFGALAQFYAAEYAKDNQTFGEQISRLKEASKLMDQAISYCSNGFSEENALIKKSLETAVKDNDFIYHERVADFKSLPPLQKICLAKPSTISGPISARFKDMFESLVPVAVQNALATFEARKNDVVNIDVSRMREYNQLMNACLASLNLPAALDDVTKQEQCPQSIREKSAQVKNNGGITDLTNKLNELPGLYKRNEEILNECSRLLKDEKETDENLRKQFTTKWTRMPSENLTPPFLQELGKFRGILQTAANADVSVRSKFEQNKRGMELLSLTENDLKLSIPGIGTYQGGASNSETVQKLRNLMNQVQEIKVEREEIEKELKKIRCDMSNDFSKALAESGVVDEQKLSSDKIANLFKPLRDKVESSIKRQDSVMEEVQLWHKKFHEERQTTGGAERENFLKGLATAYDAFFRLQGDLNEGTKFYNDLTPILVRLQQKISDFCFARQTEKEDLMKQVQQNIVSGNETTGKSAPPPRPPPPVPPPVTQSYQNQTPIPQMHPQPQLGMQQQQPPQYSYQQQPPPNPYMPYAPYPYGVQPQQQQAQMGGYNTPYPVQYPGTYPGAFPQQQFGAFPPPPAFNQQQQQPPNNPTNPFQ
uniref:BRO1 domain-containing protein n=1 Tax=Meloidogyne enterolobii TaxID=390850 RepID=A0A6V7X0J3_MELEN|nr:unnamed protein product [Meloidogyne enterolobii]